MASNLELAKRLAEFADALADLNHLPPMHTVALAPDGMVQMRPTVTSPPAVNLARLAGWADTFGTSVLVDLSSFDAGYAVLSTTVEIGGRQVLISEVVGAASFREIEERFGLGRLESGDLVQVSGQQLLAAVKEGAA